MSSGLHARLMVSGGARLAQSITFCNFCKKKWLRLKKMGSDFLLFLGGWILYTSLPRQIYATGHWAKRRSYSHIQRCFDNEVLLQYNLGGKYTPGKCFSFIRGAVHNGKNVLAILTQKLTLLKDIPARWSILDKGLKILGDIEKVDSSKMPARVRKTFTVYFWVSGRERCRKIHGVVCRVMRLQKKSHLSSILGYF